MECSSPKEKTGRGDLIRVTLGRRSAGASIHQSGRWEEESAWGFIVGTTWPFKNMLEVRRGILAGRSRGAGKVKVKKGRLQQGRKGKRQGRGNRR